MHAKGSKRIAILMLVGSLVTVAGVVAQGSPRSDGDWMTGGGWILKVPLSPEGNPGFKVTHGFEINCDGEGSNNLQINWNRGNHFHMTSVLEVQCRDDPDIDEGHPDADFDTMHGWGMGSYNNEDGFCVEWDFTDAGEPGRNDRMHVEIGTEIIRGEDGTIVDCEGDEVLNAVGFLGGGNHQAHSN